MNSDFRAEWIVHPWKNKVVYVPIENARRSSETVGRREGDNLVKHNLDTHAVSLASQRNPHEEMISLANAEK
jgi:hypothetical protein